MYVDALAEFSDAVALTATAISDVIDLGATPTLRDIGAAEPIYLVVSVQTIMDSAGDAATLVVSLESDSTADLATSPTVHMTTGTIAEATLVAGYVIFKEALPLQTTYERYLGVRYTVAVENFTTGNIDAFLTRDPEILHSYPN